MERCPASPCCPRWDRRSPTPWSGARSPGRTCPWGSMGGPGYWACSAFGCGGRRSASGRRRAPRPAEGNLWCSPGSPPGVRRPCKAEWRGGALLAWLGRGGGEMGERTGRVDWSGEGRGKGLGWTWSWGFLKEQREKSHQCWRQQTQEVFLSVFKTDYYLHSSAGYRTGRPSADCSCRSPANRGTHYSSATKYRTDKHSNKLHLLKHRNKLGSSGPIFPFDVSWAHRDLLSIQLWWLRIERKADWDMNSRECLRICVWIFSGVCLSHMNNTSEVSMFRRIHNHA